MAKGAVEASVSLMMVVGLCNRGRTEVKEDTAGDGHADGLVGLSLTSLYPELVPMNYSRFKPSC
jgi:hypothetical protein